MAAGALVRDNSFGHEPPAHILTRCSAAGAYPLVGGAVEGLLRSEPPISLRVDERQALLPRRAHKPSRARAVTQGDAGAARGQARHLQLLDAGHRLQLADDVLPLAHAAKL